MLVDTKNLTKERMEKTMMRKRVLQSRLRRRKRPESTSFTITLVNPRCPRKLLPIPTVVPHPSKLDPTATL